MKRYSILYVIRDLQIQTTIRYHYTPIRMAKIQSTDNTKHWQRCETIGTRSLVVGMQNDTATVEDSLVIFYK